MIAASIDRRGGHSSILKISGRVLTRSLRRIRPWSLTTGVDSEPDGLPISNGREAVVARHRRELAEFLASFGRRSPRLQGLSPLLRRSVTTVTDLRVLSVVTNAPAAPTLPTPKPRGQSPRPALL
ncbi:MAG UNVERIFIED_CONTAM: hypothetical protein LVR18_15200 [Planctomycetaceae bacterium]